MKVFVALVFWAVLPCLLVGMFLCLSRATRPAGKVIATYSGATLAFVFGYAVIAATADDEAAPNTATLAADTQMWAISDRADRRTCPSVDCGVVGKLLFREAAEIHEIKNGWGRVSGYYDASCVGGRSEYVGAGRADCVRENGIENGQFAEWVKLDGLSEQRPADPGAGATGIAKLVAQSDDFRHYEAEFVKAAETLIASHQCTAEDFESEGGWMKSVNKGTGIYFTYCNGGSDRIYLDVSSGRVFR